MILKAYVEKVERLREGVAVEFCFEEKPNENSEFIIHLSVEAARVYYAGQAIEVEVRPAAVGKTEKP